jgi:hypothetical protein
MRISSVKSVLDNYNELLSFLEEVSHTEHSEIGSKSSGYFKQLSTFSMYFSLKLLYMVFARSETLAHSLQSPKLSLANAERVVEALSCAWNGLRNDSKFNSLWESVRTEVDSLGIETPVLPRPRRILRRIDHGSSQSQPADDRVEDFCRRLYFATIDSACSCLTNRFKSPAFQMARNIESLTIGCINTNNTESLIRHRQCFQKFCRIMEMTLTVTACCFICRCLVTCVTVLHLEYRLQILVKSSRCSIMMPGSRCFQRSSICFDFTSLCQ